MSSRRRHVGSREDPTPSTCLGVFGLSLYTTERELEKEFSKYGQLERVSVVLDGKVTNYERDNFYQTTHFKSSTFIFFVIKVLFYFFEILSWKKFFV